MPSSCRRRCSRKMPRSSESASPEERERDWAALPQDILFAIFLKVGHLEILFGADRVCVAWWRVAVNEPLLWRRIEMGKLPISQWRWRAAVHCGAGQCESFEAHGCSDASLFYLVKRAPSLKKLRLLQCYIPLDILNMLIKQLPLLEELEIEQRDFGTSYYKQLIGTVSDACPCLKKLSLRLQYPYNSRPSQPDEDTEILGAAKCVIGMMRQLHSLKMTDCGFTAEKLVPIIDSCPVLESLHITNCYYSWLNVELQEKCRVENITVTSDSNEDP